MLRLALNRLAEKGDWDLDELKIEFRRVAPVRGSNRTFRALRSTKLIRSSFAARATRSRLAPSSPKRTRLRSLAYPRHRGARVSELPARDRAQCPSRTRSAPDHGQLRHPQDAGDPKVARHARPRWHVHFAPTASSWVNQVERASSPPSPKRQSAAASTAPLKSWKGRSDPTSRRSTTIQNPSAGPNLPTIFSPP